ncbi:MAG: glycosyltransferase involved in cell wall biosynthesis [Bacteroidia bacterium]|jgi:glycosyltransferase involved in cell wall biosynthesis
MDKISVVIPCYFNQGNIALLAKALIENEGAFKQSASFEYILVDDGSEDKTWEKIQQFKAEFPDKVKGVKLSTNVGSYSAIYAGLERATGDCIVIMAADLQDPPAHINKLFAEWKKGSKLILANRLNQAGSAGTYFGFLRRFGLKSLPKGGFDFCLFSKELKEKLLHFQPKGANSLYHLLQLEREPILVPYQKEERKTGRSRWTFFKKMALALCTIDRYSSLGLVHISVSLFLISATFLLGGVFVPGMSALGILSMIGGIVFEIVRGILRGKQQDLIIVIEQVI